MNSPVIESSPWASRPDRALEREKKREAVLKTAVRFFNTQGFRATSLDDVANSLNVTKPTIYYYFSSKDEILFECVQRGLEGIRDAAEASAKRGGSGLDRLRALIHEYALIKTRDFGMCVSRTSDDQLSPESRKRFRAQKREINDILQGVIEDGMEDGSIVHGNSRLKAFTIAGALNWIAHWYVADRQMSPEDIANEMVNSLVNGLIPSEDAKLPITRP